jgi:hypothetical protein
MDGWNRHCGNFRPTAKRLGNGSSRRIGGNGGCGILDLKFDRGWQQVHVTPVDKNEVLEGCYFSVRRADLHKHYPIAATPTMTADPRPDDTRPPERRRGPVTTHDWHSIDGEIARRCIDSKTGRVAVPQKENALVGDMRTWCKEKGWAVPAISEMSEAVRRVYAALRTVQK